MQYPSKYGIAMQLDAETFYPGPCLRGRLTALKILYKHALNTEWSRIEYAKGAEVSKCVGWE
jgi:hypothetical protein